MQHKLTDGLPTRDITYADLLEAMGHFTQAQLAQPVQVVLPNADGDTPDATMPLIAVDTVQNFFLPGPGVRTHYDDKNHLDDVILLVDYSGYGEDGSIATDLFTGEKIFPATTQRKGNDDPPSMAG